MEEGGKAFVGNIIAGVRIFLNKKWSLEGKIARMELKK